MSLYTNLQGRLRNTSLSKSHGLQPVFETVVNSIHALEEKGNLATTGKIVLRICRGNQSPISPIEEQAIPDIEGFIVEDNGVGFNDKNFESFETLDSDHKIDKGCRGVGRLLWLKAFGHVEIDSSYDSGNKTYKSRVIHFNSKIGVQLKSENEQTDAESKTLA